MSEISNKNVLPRRFAATAERLRRQVAGTALLAGIVAAGLSGVADAAEKKKTGAPINIVPAQERSVGKLSEAKVQQPKKVRIEPASRVIITPVQDRADESVEEFDNDPLEPINRVIFSVNDGLDVVIIRPIATVYKTVLPTFVRRGIGNFLSNVATPITLANDLLQGEWLRAENTIVRFMLNTTAGVGGLADVAQHVGYQRHTEDFGQTLAVYGVPSGPYLVLPILGPSSPRHAVGRVVDLFANPWFWLLADEETLVRLTPGAVSVVHARSESLESLDAIRETSPDYYVSIRSLYTQNREAEIRNGEESEDDLPDIPDVGG